MRFFIFCSLFFLFSCSRINQAERVEYTKRHPRHGVIPLADLEEKGEKLRVKKDQASIDRGQVLYQKYCMDCHGKEGRGDGMLAQDMELEPANLRETVKKVKDFDFYMDISKYKGEMPGWLYPLNSDQRRDISHYIQTFR
jgi:mono/diheme cytochrome c family protein